MTTHFQYHGWLGRTQDWEMVYLVSLLVPPATTPQKLGILPDTPVPSNFQAGYLHETQEGPGGGGGQFEEGTQGQVASVVRGGKPPTLSRAAAVLVTGSETGATGGGGEASLSGVGSGSWIWQGLRGGGVPGTQALLSLGHSCSDLGKVTHQLVMRRGRCRPRGSRRGPDPARCPGSPVACRSEAPPHASLSWGLILSQDRIPTRVRSGTASARFNFRKCGPDLGTSEIPATPPTPDPELRDTYMLPPIQGSELRESSPPPPISELWGYLDPLYL